jgi:hypothetical protein
MWKSFDAGFSFTCKSLVEAHDTMTKPNTTPVRKTCHRCVAIRFFLVAVLGVVLLQVFAPQTFQLVKGFSPMIMAALFVGAFGLVAILKSVGDHYSDHSTDSNDL